MLRRLADEAPLVYALVAAGGAAVGLGEAWQKVIVAALALLFGLVVRSITTSPSSLSAAVTNAATQTAAQLTTKTVGTAGTVTAAAEGVVTGVVHNVVNDVGGLTKVLAPEQGDSA